jgi:NAD(P)H-hydrate repair Nnr-like enzyme with NAD(P)H-hydrate epimerase domain
MDLFDLANTDYRTQIFYTSGVWRKPPSISMVFIVCIGAGGRGGDGYCVIVCW